MAAANERPAPASRVHVFDDDEAVRRAIAMLLRSAGICAEIYPSGLAFIDILPIVGDALTECVPTDMRMP